MRSIHCDIAHYLSFFCLKQIQTKQEEYFSSNKFHLYPDYDGHIIRKKTAIKVIQFIFILYRAAQFADQVMDLLILCFYYLLLFDANNATRR